MLPNTSALSQSAASQQVHGLPELVRTVLAHLAGPGDPGAACKAVADFCAVDQAHRGGCQAAGDPNDPRNPWRLVTNHAFRSTAGDRALFAHDDLLATDPKAAFQAACKDRQIAHAGALDFIATGLFRANRAMFSDWEHELMEYDGDIRREDMYDAEGTSADEILADFHEEHPVTSKVTEWRLVARDEWKRCTEYAKYMWEAEIKPTFPDGEMGWLGQAAVGEIGDRGPDLTLMGILSSDEEYGIFGRRPRSRPLAQILAEAERDLRVLAERVGQATVWAYHTDTGSRFDAGGRNALTYVLSGPRVL